MREMAEMAVGERDVVRVNSLKIHDVRFNVPITVHESGPGVLKGGPVPLIGKTQLTITLENGELLHSVEFGTRHARTFLPEIPAEDDALALERPHLKLIIRGDLKTLNVVLDMRDVSAPACLADFGPSCEVFCELMNRPSDSIRVRATFENGPPLD